MFSGYRQGLMQNISLQPFYRGGSSDGCFSERVHRLALSCTILKKKAGPRVTTMMPRESALASMLDTKKWFNFIPCAWRRIHRRYMKYRIFGWNVRSMMIHIGSSGFLASLQMINPLYTFLFYHLFEVAVASNIS